jgi:hypothetical protein
MQGQQRVQGPGRLQRALSQVSVRTEHAKQAAQVSGGRLPRCSRGPTTEPPAHSLRREANASAADPSRRLLSFVRPSFVRPSFVPLSSVRP